MTFVLQIFQNNQSYNCAVFETHPESEVDKFHEVPIILVTVAINQNIAVVVESRGASVARPTVLRPCKDARFADLAFVIVLPRVEINVLLFAKLFKLG